ncbi:LysR family transcriptional regulator [Inquilinus limosus]|uniref:LysR family transcriptional regulator n=1 Tax=Inquilinus limosus TaxID=171674 RepID=A0A211ZLF7_9PROT|nr:LysR family transcriptional regulator [Inquilinus limosus]OWJ66123.1 LysR family transcriptional regulator [Inquilinus limosus]
MDNLNGLAAFVRAAEARSFVAAGRELGLTASAVGKAVAKLEERLGARLFQRSTRRISLTAEGTLFYERCQRILGDIADAEAELQRALDAPRGRLRVSMPLATHRLLVPVLPEFLRAYPEIELDLDFNDRIVDVIEAGLDVVMRSGALGDSRLMSRRVGQFRFHVVASPGYLARHGVPARPADLERHACLRYKFPTSGAMMEWTLQAEPGTPPWRVPATLVSNSTDALIAAAERGLGLLYTADFIVGRALQAGTLRTVLDAYEAPPGLFWALWPSSRQLSPKVRVFVDFLCTRLIPAP